MTDRHTDKQNILIVWWSSTLLNFCIRRGEIIEKLLKIQLFLNITKISGETALFALLYSYEESKYDDVNDFNKIIAVLLEFGADPAETGTQLNPQL